MKIKEFLKTIGEKLKKLWEGGKIKEGLKIVGNAFIWLVFALSLIMVVLSLNSTGGVPNIFGTGYLSVQTDSMAPTFNPGDMIIVNTTSSEDVFQERTMVYNPETEEMEVEHEGDIVTFWTVISGERVLNTHRIIAKQEIYGIMYYTTQGDNEAEADLATITAGDIVAKYTGTKLVGWGGVMDYIQSRTGFLICVVLPLAGLFIYQIINFAILIAKYKEEEDKKKPKEVSVDELTDEQKAEIAKKYLESLNAEKQEK